MDTEVSDATRQRPRVVRLITLLPAEGDNPEGWYITYAHKKRRHYCERLGDNYGWFATDDEALAALIEAYPRRVFLARRVRCRE